MYFLWAEFGRQPQAVELLVGQTDLWNDSEMRW